MGIWDEIRKTFRDGSSLTKLIYINIAVFILITLVAIIGYLVNDRSISEKAINLFAIPALFSSFFTKPWTIITYISKKAIDNHKYGMPTRPPEIDKEFFKD